MIKDFEWYLNEYKTRHNLTTEDLAYRSGYSKSYIGKILRSEIEPAYSCIKTIINSLEFSEYSGLVAFYRYKGFVKLGSEIHGYEIPEANAIAAIETGRYKISSIWRSFRPTYKNFDEDHKDQFQSLSHLSVETDIKEERLKEIIDSCDKDPQFPITIMEVVQICHVMNKKWHELFVLSCSDIHNKDIVHVAVTLDMFVEKEKLRLVNHFSEKMKDDLSADEVTYLKEMLKIYRNLKLKPTNN
ncbi:hypothetical protein ACX93W_21920 [Paenibacillus sp. CAU 1782]